MKLAKKFLLGMAIVSVGFASLLTPQGGKVFVHTDTNLNTNVNVNVREINLPPEYRNRIVREENRVVARRVNFQNVYHDSYYTRWLTPITRYVDRVVDRRIIPVREPQCLWWEGQWCVVYEHKLWGTKDVIDTVLIRSSVPYQAWNGWLVVYSDKYGREHLFPWLPASVNPFKSSRYIRIMGEWRGYHNYIGVIGYVPGKIKLDFTGMNLKVDKVKIVYASDDGIEFYPVSLGFGYLYYTVGFKDEDGYWYWEGVRQGVVDFKARIGFWNLSWAKKNGYIIIPRGGENSCPYGYKYSVFRYGAGEFPLCIKDYEIFNSPWMFKEIGAPTKILYLKIALKVF